MTDVLTDKVARFVRAAGPSPDDTLREMDEYAAESGFPHVGPEVGGTLALLARMTGARSVFEFGSGYGYSAYWFARALPDDGRIVLTEIDEDELEMAREYMQAGGFGDIAEYELGDALEIVERYDGPFDLVLLDHQKRRYPEAFEAVRSKVPVGGAIVADNAMTADSIQFETVLEFLEARDRGPERRNDDLTEDIPNEATDATRGIATYLATVRDDEAFETTVLPLGEGIAVSYRTE
ncbi:O-methyltransferase family 3 [Halostagnicola larsenii XH-48]|uniref:O-methyltransferase family 3 n=1 Tax=Halostagnicola larsenii XH-48 TaxID=797299 RepID=W0JPK5_9EURY|nr:O-methyltransferase [Halostagnicola larsenii]AHF99221.1 O-methyltransferase family 3 [Halostagnicola larsenii XH-48]